MLVLSRKSGESLIIGSQIVVKVLKIEGDSVKIGIEAPLEVPVYREEVYREIKENNKQAVTLATARLPRMKFNGGISNIDKDLAQIGRESTFKKGGMP